MSNPFAITSDELLKRQQGINAANGTDGVKNTQETRAAKEKEQLKGTNVLAQTNGGSMATTDGVFETYDGFVRTTSATNNNDNSMDSQVKANLQKGESAKSDAAAAKEESTSAKAAAQKASDTAIQDKQDVNNLSKQVKQRSQQTTQKVNTNNNKIEGKIEENQNLENEINDIENEIADLMAEDGQDYTPDLETADDSQPPAPAQAPQQGGEGSTPTAAADGTAGADVAQPFAMNSLSAGGTEYAPTSITGVAAQASGQAADGAQGTQQNNNTPQGSSQQNGTNNKSATTASGGSLKAFGMTVSGGKHADRIAELQAESSDKKSTRSSNSNTINSLRTTNMGLLSSTKSFITSSTSTTSTKKATSQQGQKAAQTAQTVGTVTTAVGGLTTATGLTMQLWTPTAEAGKVVEVVGVGTTGVGTATTGVAAVSQGNTTEGVNAASQGLQQMATSAKNLKSLKTS